MPNLESVRRIIGKDIVQRYISDNEGGECMLTTGTFTSNNIDQSFTIGFKPKALLVVGEENLYIFTEFGFYNIYDYEIQDYDNITRAVTSHTLRPTSPSTRCSFNDDGFTVRLVASSCFYIAIG